MQAKLKNHPSLIASRASKAQDQQKNDRPPWRDMRRTKLGTDARVLKSDTTETDTETPPRDQSHCLFHERNGHKLSECNAFRRKSLKEKNEFIREARLCFRCLTANHFAKDCPADIKCNKCGSDRHLEILHIDKKETDPDEEVEAKCTAVCEGRKGGRSCSKIVLFDILTNDQNRAERVYGVIDDQSNASMISPDLIKKLDLSGPKEKYLLTTCSVEREVRYGRRITGLLTRSLDGKLSELPTLVECDHIPQDKSEIPTPKIANRFSHLERIAGEIPPLDTDTKIQILIGRDAPELMKVRASINGPKGAPWAQKLDLDWTISGQVCLNTVGGAVHVTAYRTKASILPTRAEVAQCPNQFEIKERFLHGSKGNPTTNDADLYQTTADDTDIGMSREDRHFLETMERSIHKSKQGNWEMPLPFRSCNTNLPNNRTQALNRLNALLRTFKKKPQMKKDYIEFMAELFDRGHAIFIPPNQHSPNHPPDGQLWYLPHFGVYHPKKPEQIRVVFDSSAEYQGVSLNKELLAGPDQMNSLFGVLVRFR